MFSAPNYLELLVVCDVFAVYTRLRICSGCYRLSPAHMVWEGVKGLRDFISEKALLHQLLFSLEALLWSSHDYNRCGRGCLGVKTIFTVLNPHFWSRTTWILLCDTVAALISWTHVFGSNLLDLSMRHVRSRVLHTTCLVEITWTSCEMLFEVQCCTRLGGRMYSS